MLQDIIMSGHIEPRKTMRPLWSFTYLSSAPITSDEETQSPIHSVKKTHSYQATRSLCSLCWIFLPFALSLQICRLLYLQKGKHNTDIMQTSQRYLQIKYKKAYANKNLLTATPHIFQCRAYFYRGNHTDYSLLSCNEHLHPTRQKPSSARPKRQATA